MSNFLYKIFQDSDKEIINPDLFYPVIKEANRALDLNISMIKNINVEEHSEDYNEGTFVIITSLKSKELSLITKKINKKDYDDYKFKFKAKSNGNVLILEYEKN